MLDSTQRFSSRVNNYVKYRPSYPSAILDLLRAECGLTPQSLIADIGSGTGLLARSFQIKATQPRGLRMRTNSSGALTRSNQ